MIINVNDDVYMPSVQFLGQANLLIITQKPIECDVVVREMVPEYCM